MNRAYKKRSRDQGKACNIPHFTIAVTRREPFLYATTWLKDRK
jgi:hypothetical protein